MNTLYVVSVVCIMVFVSCLLEWIENKSLGICPLKQPPPDLSLWSQLKWWAIIFFYHEGKLCYAFWILSLCIVNVLTIKVVINYPPLFPYAIMTLGMIFGTVYSWHIMESIVVFCEKRFRVVWKINNVCGKGEWLNLEQARAGALHGNIRYGAGTHQVEPRNLY